MRFFRIALWAALAVLPAGPLAASETEAADGSEATDGAEAELVEAELVEGEPPAPPRELPDIEPGEYVLVTPDAHEPGQTQRLEECIETFDSSAYADYFAFVYANEETYTYSAASSGAYAEAEELLERWAQHAVAPRRAVLITYNVVNQAQAYAIGQRWIEAGFYDDKGGFRGAIEFADNDYDKRICKLVKLIDDSLGRLVEQSAITSQRDIDSRAWLIQERFRGVWDRTVSIREQAEEELGKDSPLYGEIEDILDAQDTHSVIDTLAEADLTIERALEADSRFKEARAQIDRLREANQHAFDRLDDYRHTKTVLPTQRDRFEKLRAQIDQRSEEQLVWGGEEAVRADLRKCEDGLAAARTKIERGKYPDGVTEYIDRCIEAVAERADDADGLNMAVTRIAPAAVGFVVLSLGFVAFFRRRRRRSDLTLELTAEVDNWSETLDLLGGRLDRIFSDYDSYVRLGEFGPHATDDRVEASTMRELERACALRDELRRRHDEASKVADKVGRASLDKVEQAVALLTEPTTIELPGEDYEGTPEDALTELRESIRIVRAGLCEFSDARW